MNYDMIYHPVTKKNISIYSKDAYDLFMNYIKSSIQKGGTTPNTKEPKFKNSKKINFLVLSMDNDLGLRRRNKLNYDFTWVKGKLHTEAPKFVKDKMIFKHYHSDRFKKVLVGVWWAWYKLFDKIVKEKLDNVIALEDDCFQIGEIDLNKLGDQPIWVNGAIHHPTRLSESTKEWEDSIKVKKGINKLEDIGVRVISMWGLYIPKWQQAKEIRDKLKNSKRYRCTDAQVSHQQLVKYLYYSALFKHKDFGESSAQKKGGKWENRMYWKFREK